MIELAELTEALKTLVLDYEQCKRELAELKDKIRCKNCQHFCHVKKHCHDRVYDGYEHWECGCVKCQCPLCKSAV